MSRARLLRCQRDKLGCQIAEWQCVMEHIADYCRISDQLVKQKFGEGAIEDKVLSEKNMPEEQYIEFAKECIEILLQRYGLRKKRQLVQAQEEEYSGDVIAITQGQVLMQEAIAQQKEAEMVPN